MKNAQYKYSRTGHFILLAALAAAGWPFRATPAAAQETIRQYLSGRDAESPVAWEFFCSQGRNSGFWTNIAVPSCWETQGFGAFRYGHEDKNFEPIECHYRHRFAVPAEWRGRRVFLVFDGVMTDAAVKINGQEAGPPHQGAFYRFKYDVTGKIKFAGENLLEVSVSDKSADASVNNAERSADYWVFGGIFRPVWLEAQPAQFVERVAIDARADGAFALNYYPGGEGGADAVEVTIQDAQGKSAAPPVSAPVTAGRVTTKVAEPALWTAETPALYTAVVRLKQGAAVLHEMRQRFGFRTVEVRAGDGIYINGRRVLFRGVCHHVAWPMLGRSSSDRIARLDVGLIREMNMDAARMSHYPPDEAFLDLCDEQGLYVLDELAGWQHRYDTEIGRARLQDMIARDVNHPCIVLWDNANEGGWNTNLDGDFAQLDPQQRAVVHPGGGKFGAILNRHYPDWRTLGQELAGRDIVMPTEFLHGLYDGGAGAGLDDYWNAMRASKVSAGGFLWVFADEGVLRNDSNNVIDVKGNWAPDGIMGPYREKEGSFYTIKEIYCPVQLPRALPADFDGALPVENRYEFTSLSKCSFTWRLRRFEPMPGGGAPAPGPLTAAEGSCAGPDVAPGHSGTLNLPYYDAANWRTKDAEALEVTARDPGGRELWTWVWRLQPNAKFAPTGGYGINATQGVNGGIRVVHANHTTAFASPVTGSLYDVEVDGQKFSFRGEPIPQSHLSILESGWLKLEFTNDPAVGVVFDYPEEKMLKKTWLGDGPYHVWRNRLKGGTFGVWETAFNTTETGYKDWVYPEFAGYFANVRWLRLTTTEGVITLMIPDENTFVRVGTPEFPPANLAGKTVVKFPPGNLAVLRDIPPMGNKFHNANQTGPQATTPLASEPYHGTVYLRFER
ncbi:MAG: glycoside hydrolase family 2 TIM barrel-domain containing protein [Verrucomicrobiota bacterium]|jgi:hypothetical protein